MVYPGKRSSGCGLCRKRKIKCDERRPGCRRCELHKAPCPGYEKPLEIRMCHGQRDKRRRSRSRSQSSDPPSQPPPHKPFEHQSLAVISSRNPLQPMQLDPPWDELAVSYFLSEYSVAPLPGMYSGHLDFLSDLLAPSSSASPLWPATRASGCLTLSRRYKSARLYNEARKHYGAALRSVHASLSQPPETWREDTLGAIMLLHHFEDIDGEVIDNQAVHLRGITGLYKARGQILLNEITECSLYNWAFAQLQIHAFATHTSYECLTIPEPEPHIAGNYPTGGTIVIAKVGRFWSSLIERLTDFRRDTGTRQQHRRLLLSSVDEARRIQMDMDAWDNSLPTSWLPRETISDDGRLLLTYADRWMGTTSMLYYAVQIILNLGLLSCCQALLGLQIHDDTSSLGLIESFMASAEENLVQLTNIICRSIPYSLGEVDINGHALTVPDYKGSICYNMIWPLALVAQLDYSTEDQVELCTRTLERIRSVYGIKLAGSAQHVAIDFFSQWNILEMDD